MPSSVRAAANAQLPILIVGAGMAGLTAAWELNKRGIPTVILEGRDRIGGRIHTWRGLSAPVDLGASWIHGAEGNPVTALAEGFGVRTLPTDMFNNATHRADGRQMTPNEFMAFSGAGMRLVGALKKHAASLTEDIPLDLAIEQVLQTEPRIPLEDDLRRLAVAGLETQFAAEISDVSTISHGDATGFSGKDRLFPDGYEQVILGLRAGLDVRTGCVVRRIEHGGPVARVITDNGTFEGRGVIVTVPLGVLKASKIEFDPALPDRKRLAIERLHMGVLNKVALEFPCVFWREEVDFTFLAPASSDTFPNFVNLARLTGRPILVALAGGELGRRMETTADDEIVRGAMKSLRTIFADAPDPTAFTITRWGRDPFSLGSYSHIPPGASGDDYDAMAEPAGERLFFAGEATMRGYQSTVHGAHLSGLREARRFSQA